MRPLPEKLKRYQIRAFVFGSIETAAARRYEQA
jgi:hypothetical protein